MVLLLNIKKLFTRTASGPVSLILLLILVIASGCAHNKVDKRKDNSNIHYRLGNEYYRTGNIADALKEFTKAISIYPEEPSYHLMLGFAYSSRDLDKEAEEEMAKAVTLNPMFSEGHIGLASLYKKKGDWDGVISECRLALKNIYYKTPETAYFNMGLAYYNKGDYGLSVESFKKAVSMKAGMVVSYYNMGLSYERLKKTDKALDSYRRALSYQVEYVAPYFRLGVVLVKEGEKDEALQAFKKVVELAPGSVMARSAREYMDLLQ